MIRIYFAISTSVGYKRQQLYVFLELASTISKVKRMQMPQVLAIVSCLCLFGVFETCRNYCKRQAFCCLLQVSKAGILLAHPVTRAGELASPTSAGSPGKSTSMSSPWESFTDHQFGGGQSYWESRFPKNLLIVYFTLSFRCIKLYFIIASYKNNRFLYSCWEQYCLEF